MARYPYRVLSARWTKTKDMPSFTASIKISGTEDIGIVNKIADIVSGYTVSVRAFNYRMNDGLFEGILNLMVPNNDVLHLIIKKIQSVKGVLKASRQNTDQN